MTVTDSGFRSINGTESKVHEASAWLGVYGWFGPCILRTYTCIVDGPFLLFIFIFQTPVLLFLIASPVRYHINSITISNCSLPFTSILQVIFSFILHDVGVLSLFNKGSRSGSRSISTDPPRTKRRQKKAMSIPAPISDDAVASENTPLGSCHRVSRL